MIIAIDGPAGAGKSTIAKRLAEKLKFVYIDTGAMYRALALKSIEQKIPISDTAGLIAMAASTQIDLRQSADGTLSVLLDGKDVSRSIREPRVSAIVSDVAKVKEIRDLMVCQQRRMGESKDVILDGRDIGTVVFPHADKKFFLDADQYVRAKRRHKEFVGEGKQIALTDVQKDVCHRDTIDSTRAVAPLKKADDALYLDTTHMSIDDVVQEVLRYIKTGDGSHDKAKLSPENRPRF